jgi:hypothetical protein
MTAELMAILSEETNSFLSQVKTNLDTTGTSATGKTKDSLRYEITEEGSRIVITVFGKPYFAVVETGRKPTPDKKPSRAMIDSIKEWLSARGKPESMAWAVATKINKEGTKLWQQGGRTDIYTDLKEGFADKIFMEVSEQMASEYFRQATVSFE